MADYEVIDFGTGEFGLKILSSRAVDESGNQAGFTIAFKSRSEALEYVVAAEADGFTFLGRELLQPSLRPVRRWEKKTPPS